MSAASVPSTPPARARAEPGGQRALTASLLVVTFGTGIVDAISWISLSGVFTANMTGNVLIVGMGAVGAGGSHWFPSLFALCWFFVGAGIVGRLMRRAAPGWGRRTTVVFASVAVTLGAVAVLAAFLPPHRLDPVALTATAAMATAMGAQGAAAMRLAVPGLVTVAVSSATIGVGMSLFLGLGAHGQGVLRRFLAIVLLSSGAFVGAVLSRYGLSPALLLAALAAGSATVIGHRLVRGTA